MSRIKTGKILGKGCPTWAAFTDLDGLTRELRHLVETFQFKN